MPGGDHRTLHVPRSGTTCCFGHFPRRLLFHPLEASHSREQVALNALGAPHCMWSLASPTFGLARYASEEGKLTQNFYLKDQRNNFCHGFLHHFSHQECRPLRAKQDGRDCPQWFKHNVFKVPPSLLKPVTAQNAQDSLWKAKFLCSVTRHGQLRRETPPSPF